MKISSADVLNSHLKPLCSRDNHVMKYEAGGSQSNTGYRASYRGLAEITTKESFFTNTFARLSGATLKDGKLQFPFRIGGTINNPVFSKGRATKM